LQNWRQFAERAKKIKKEKKERKEEGRKVKQEELFEKVMKRAEQEKAQEEEEEEERGKAQQQEEQEKGIALQRLRHKTKERQRAEEAAAATARRSSASLPQAPGRNDSLSGSDHTEDGDQSPARRRQMKSQTATLCAAQRQGPEAEEAQTEAVRVMQARLAVTLSKYLERTTTKG